MEIAEILNRAADLIEPEGAWIQTTLCRDADGKEVMFPHTDKAVCFCAQGALYAVTDALPVRGGGLWDKANSFLSDHLGTSVPYWNDQPERTQAEVVAALREAAKKASK